MQAAPIPSVPVGPALSDVEKPVSEEWPIVETETKQAVEPDVAPVAQLTEDKPSLERLTFTKRMRVKNMIFLRGMRNTFTVRLPDETLVYNVEESNRWWVGYLFYGLRPLKLRISDVEGKDIVRIKRPFALTSRVFPCALQRVAVLGPQGQPLGAVRQRFTTVVPEYLVMDEQEREVFNVNGPKSTLGIFHDVQFTIRRPDGAPVGAVCKRWQGLGHYIFKAPIRDRFVLSLEQELTGAERSLLLSAALLIAYMYFDV